jgi:CheY-like chemotaxis protein/HPt (histidine-containing phosphotransfer) domain-containing protein
LVEDEPVNAAVAQGYLAALGCTYVWVESGTAALERSAAERFDLILMDLNMPGMDGLQAARHIRQREGGGQRIPIIALTAHDASAYRDICVAAGMDDLLTKPYTLDACGALLQRWLPDSVPRPGAPARTVDIAEEVEAASHPLSEIDSRSVAGIRNINSGKGADLYARLAELFRSSSSSEISSLRAALDAGDLVHASRICHRLKSSAANIGAIALSKAVRELEQLCVDKDAGAATHLYETVAAAYPALLETLHRVQMRA